MEQVRPNARLRNMASVRLADARDPSLALVLWQGVCIYVPATELAQLAALTLVVSACGPNGPTIPFHAGLGDAEVWSQRP